MGSNYASQGINYDSTDTIPWYLRANLSAVPPPPGIISNFVDPPSKAINDKIVCGLCIPIVTLLVAMKVYTKTRVIHAAGWEDVTSVLAYILFIIFCVTSQEMDRNGDGRHVWDMKGYAFTKIEKWAWAQRILYPIVIFATKLAIILLYIKVFRPIRHAYIVLLVVLYLNLAFYFSGIWVEAFACKPLIKTWLPLYPGKCINQAAAETASAIINIVSDFALLILPICMVWTLQTDRKRKIGLIAVFAFGLLACLASIARLVIFVTRSADIDGTWELYNIGPWTIAEIAIGIACGCLPCTPSFIRHVRGLPALSKSARPSQYPSYQSGSNKTGSAYTSRTDSAVKSPGLPLPHQSSISYPMSPISSEKRENRRRSKNGWDELSDLEYTAGDEGREGVETKPQRTPKIAKMGVMSEAEIANA